MHSSVIIPYKALFQQIHFTANSNTNNCAQPRLLVPWARDRAWLEGGSPATHPCPFHPDIWKQPIQQPSRDWATFEGCSGITSPFGSWWALQKFGVLIAELEIFWTSFRSFHAVYQFKDQQRICWSNSKIIILRNFQLNLLGSALLPIHVILWSLDYT